MCMYIVYCKVCFKPAASKTLAVNVVGECSSLQRVVCSLWSKAYIVKFALSQQRVKHSLHLKLASAYLNSELFTSCGLKHILPTKLYASNE